MHAYSIVHPIYPVQLVPALRPRSGGPAKTVTVQWRSIACLCRCFVRLSNHKCEMTASTNLAGADNMLTFLGSRDTLPPRGRLLQDSGYSPAPWV